MRRTGHSASLSLVSYTLFFDWSRLKTAVKNLERESVVQQLQRMWSVSADNCRSWPLTRTRLSTAATRRHHRLAVYRATCRRSKEHTERSCRVCSRTFRPLSTLCSMARNVCGLLFYCRDSTVADQKILTKGAEDNLSASSSFIANAHNKIYAFYMEKAAFWKKYEPVGRRPPPRPPPLNLLL